MQMTLVILNNITATGDKKLLLFLWPLLKTTTGDDSTHTHMMLSAFVTSEKILLTFNILQPEIGTKHAAQLTSRMTSCNTERKKKQRGWMK